MDVFNRKKDNPLRIAHPGRPKSLLTAETPIESQNIGTINTTADAIQ